MFKSSGNSTYNGHKVEERGMGSPNTCPKHNCLLLHRGILVQYLPDTKQVPHAWSCSIAEGSKHSLYMQSVNKICASICSIRWLLIAGLLYCRYSEKGASRSTVTNTSAVIFQSAEFSGKRTAAGQRVYLTENMHTEWLLVLLFICIVY